jgi:hypothetical protein
MPLDGPSGQDIEHLATRVAIRLGRYFEQERGLSAGGCGEAEVAAIDCEGRGLLARPT